MGNSKIVRVVVAGEFEGTGKYVWREEPVGVENFVEKEFKLRPRGRQKREFGSGEETRAISLPVAGTHAQTKC